MYLSAALCRLIVIHGHLQNLLCQTCRLYILKHMTKTNLLSAFMVVSLLTFHSFAQSTGYTAEVREIDSKDQKTIFNIVVDKKIESGKETVIARSMAGAELALEEIGVLDAKDSSVLEYRVDNKQTNESGKLIFEGDKIFIEFNAKGQPTVKKEIPKPKYLVAPANFEQYLQKNFETLKRDKKMSVDFLIWDRLETIKFKISYLGETKLNDETVHHFKMNVDNFLIAAFVTPIQMWYTQDMTKVRRFLGRVSVKKKNTDGSLSNLDADVKYTYK